MNLMVIIVLLLIVFKIADGYKKGMVKEIISFVSLIVMCVVVVLISAGLHSFMEKQVLGVIIAILLLGLLGIAHHLLGVIFFSAKVISKLPIIHWVDKLLGMVVGALEVVLILWTLYTFIMYFGLGAIGGMILEYTKQSGLLTTVYEYNLLAPIVESVLSEIAM
ncbi:MAG: CvpA family protein [Lachnospiraceae bacterium]|nr:CvpA family protein [Lachnospiraceae bacterium]